MRSTERRACKSRSTNCANSPTKKSKCTTTSSSRWGMRASRPHRLKRTRQSLDKVMQTKKLEMRTRKENRGLKDVRVEVDTEVVDRGVLGEAEVEQAEEWQLSGKETSLKETMKKKTLPILRLWRNHAEPSSAKKIWSSTITTIRRLAVPQDLHPKSEPYLFEVPVRYTFCASKK